MQFITVLVVGGKALPWCRNGTEIIHFSGGWNTAQNEFILSPNSPCDISNSRGLDALEALRGLHLVFIGDSMLRQVTKMH